MRVCLLTYDDRDPKRPDQRPVPADPRPFLPDADWTRVELEKATAAKRLIQLTRDDYDLFFNLCDGGWDSEAPGIEVVGALERLHVPFTGADSVFYDPSREAMKRICSAWGIDTPGYVMARREEDVDRAADTLAFPLIVKHPASYSSIGLTRDSRVENAAALREQARHTMAERGSALIEEFIEGGEATVLVAEDPDDPATPVTYTPIAYRFPEGESFKHFDLKWHDYHGLSAAPVMDAILSDSLRDASARLFTGLRGAGYGRCDLRIDRDGRPFMLEINPNCGIYYPPSDPGSADLCLLHSEDGHRGFTRRVVEAAFRRHRDRERGWEVRPVDDGYGVFACRAFSPGDIIMRFEEEQHVLVSRSRVEAAWDERRADWFRRYAWPITDEIWVTWDEDPEKWRPINHSCEPTAWLEGLDVTARTGIATGDPITLDYATFYNHVMPDFDCACGADRCRGVVRGTDYLGTVVERYGDHVSDYVRQARAARQAVGDQKRSRGAAQ